MENREGPTDPEDEKNPEKEKMLDVLEDAFEKKLKVRLTVSEPSGEVKTSEVIIEAFNKDMLYVSLSEDSHVIGININDIKSADFLNNNS